MSSSLVERAPVADDVAGYLARRDAHRALDSMYLLIERCFPASRSVDVWLQDPEEEGRRRIVLSPVLPATTAIEEVLLGVRQFHNYADQFPAAASHNLFSLVPASAAD